jgi:ubiquitin-conjugating enzyme E2 H
MSDIEITLVNDNMQEFYVRFFGPAESQFRNDSPTQTGRVA